MCALFGTKRDFDLVSSINRELLGDIISQQASIYKFKLSETKSNIYGESPSGKFYDGPYIFNCLIDRQDQVYNYGDVGGNINQIIKPAFFKRDLEEANVLLEAGDVILYQELYYEISGLIENQYFVGKNSDYPNNPNPLNPGLENFGGSVSIVAVAFYIPSDKLNISPYSERF